MKQLSKNNRERFLRLAEQRTNKVLNMLSILGGCSNRNLYEYSQEDIDKIFSVLENEVSKQKNRFIKFNFKKFEL